jgi:hypothetical protein
VTASTPFDAGAARDQHPPAPVSSTATRVRRRRRPSGEPPPLPRQLHTSGKGWLLLIGVAVVAGVLIGNVQQAAVAADVVDHAVLSAFEGIRTPWLTQAARAAGVLSNPAPLGMLAVWWATLAVLVIWRRWRHLLVCAVALFVVTLGSTVASDMLHRPRPLGVEILGSWTESPLPSVPMAFLTAILVTGLYTLVPAGRLRERGKLVVAGLLAVTALSRFYLAQEGPFDVLFAVVVGVAIPLAAFRLFVPNETFPVNYRRGRTAHLDVTGARHDAIAQALEEQLGVIPVAIKPFNLEGSGGSTPLRITVKGDPETAFGELRPSPWRQAVDLGNMMLVLALRTSPERVYARARHQFSVAEITEAFAATRGLTMPSQLRQMMRQQGRDLHAEFVALLPEPPHPIRIQQWTMRRVALIVGLVIVAVPLTVIVVTMLNPI